MFQQLCREQPIVSCPISRLLSRGCCIGNERSSWCSHLRQSPAATAETPSKRIVAAGIQNHDVHPIVRCLHLPKELTYRDSTIAYIGFSARVDFDWEQIILTINLHPVACIVEQTYTIIAP